MYNFEQYVDLSILPILLLIGKFIKSSEICKKIPNKYITIILPIIGVIIEYVMKREINIDIITIGIFTGLAATGTHQFLKQMFNNDGIKVIPLDEEESEEEFDEDSDVDEEEEDI